jgi:hypothetical protein
MMNVAVALLAVFVVVNLILTIGLIRRIRTMAQEGSSAPEIASKPQPGKRLGHFAVTTSEGRRFTERDLATGSHLVAFLSPTCPSCRAIKDQMAAGLAGESMVVFIAAFGDEQVAAEMVRALTPVAVTTLMADESAAEAFGSSAFPTLVRVVDGVITESGHRIDDLSRPLPVTAGA